MYNIAGNTRDASSELTKAARYQRSSRGRAFCLLVILFVILAVILLAVSFIPLLFHERSNKFQKVFLG